jgi:GDPmannose 4,6-dehydratase
MKTAFITGITGQVGSTLADFLLSNTDWNLIGLMRWQEPLDNIRHLSKQINNNERISIVYGDLNDSFSISNALNQHHPDYIFHLAAQSYPKTSFDIPIETLMTNIIGTTYILEACRTLAKNNEYSPIIHICSSSEVYGKVKNNKLITEDSELSASSPYSLSKISTDFLGKFYADAYSLKTFITRMGTHSGPRRSDVFFESTVAKQIALIEGKHKDPILHLGNLDSVRTFQDCRDAVRAYYLLTLEMEKGNIKYGDHFNISGNKKFKLSEVVEIFLSLSKVKNIKIKTDKARIRPIDADYQMFDNRKIKKYLDWEPKYSVEQMFSDLLDFWRDEIKNNRIPLDR